MLRAGMALVALGDDLAEIGVERRRLGQVRDHHRRGEQRDDLGGHGAPLVLPPQLSWGGGRRPEGSWAVVTMLMTPPPASRAPPHRGFRDGEECSMRRAASAAAAWNQACRPGPTAALC